MGALHFFLPRDPNNLYESRIGASKSLFNMICPGSLNLCIGFTRIDLTPALFAPQISVKIWSPKNSVFVLSVYIRRIPSS